MGGTTLPNEVRGLDSVIHLGDFAYPKTPPTLKWTVTNPRYGKMKQVFFFFFFCCCCCC